MALKPFSRMSRLVICVRSVRGFAEKLETRSPIRSSKPRELVSA
jgi:hypothetical protein